MDFDFQKEFTNSSALELLKIIRNPGNYQPAAVEAARLVLSARNISQEEMDEANRELLHLEEEEKRKQEKIEAYKANVTGVLSSLIVPDQELKASKWLKFLLLLLGIQYIRLLFRSIQTFIFLVGCETCGFDILWLITAINIFFIPLIFYLLLKRKRWGWIILCGENIFSGVLLLTPFLKFIGNLVYHIYYIDIDSDELASWDIIWPVIIRTLFAIFLFRKEITSYFNVGRKIKERTIMVAVFLALLFVASVRYWY